MKFRNKQNTQNRIELDRKKKEVNRLQAETLQATRELNCVKKNVRRLVTETLQVAKDFDCSQKEGERLQKETAQIQAKAEQLKKKSPKKHRNELYSSDLDFGDSVMHIKVYEE